MKAAWWWPVVVPLVGTAVVVGAILAVGAWTRDWLRDQPRARLAWNQIDCRTPPGLTKEEFLNEVQYLSDVPDELSLLDEHLSLQLREAFSRHPWVDSVNGIEVRPAYVSVNLTFRWPTLAVVHSGQTRAVNGQGVILPASADCTTLPTVNLAGKPPGPSGSLWDDEAVVAAAWLASFLRPLQDEFPLQVIEVTDGEMVLNPSSRCRVLWGHAPPQETESEAVAADKLVRLRDFLREAGDLSAGETKELDLRPRDKAHLRTLP